ncbi:hypothetical protein CCMSSC00406_0006073 [Pleurotus cornucopiae]|uniref:Uncharacterized protein n=1 Tax=Pleurotus cornucopiae TaxID=5321 RepID=A0ACB7J7Y8_PLECO|nr:hypothetical protein CCMSSC00406_0006073 [Pleurotus cornucopiae]
MSGVGQGLPPCFLPPEFVQARAFPFCPQGLPPPPLLASSAISTLYPTSIPTSSNTPSSSLRSLVHLIQPLVPPHPTPPCSLSFLATASFGPYPMPMRYLHPSSSFISPISFFGVTSLFPLLVRVRSSVLPYSPVSTQRH